MATLTADQLNSIAKQSGYTGGSFSSTGLQQTPTLSAPAIQSPAPGAPSTPIQTTSTTNYMPGSYDAILQSAKAPSMAYGATNTTQDPNAALTQKYQSGLQTMQTSGVPAPQTSSDGIQAAKTIAPPTQAPTLNPTDIFLSQDKGYQDLIKTYQDYTNSQNQQQSLTDLYKQMSKDAGLEQLNTDLINSQKIIQGTEQDIRNEISSVGGFGTESQVQALAAARNKGLISNYNTLLQTRDNAQSQINNMLQLTQQDRQYAQQQFENQVNFQKQLIDYRDKFINNAKESYNAIIKAQGYAGLYNAVAQDPNAVSLVERTLGLQPGQLAQLATYQAPMSEEDQLNLDLKRSQLATDQLQRQNIQSQINERNNQAPVNTLNGKAQSADQVKAQSFGDRLNEADVIIANLGDKFTSAFSLGGLLPNALQSGDRQAYEQAKKNFVTAVLRRESGASIAPSEFKTAEEQYFPQAGDKPDVLINKANARNTAINNMYREANILRPVLPGQIIESGGKKYRVASDGETLQEI